MKCLCIDGMYYRFPEEYSSIEEFVDAVNTGALPAFVRMTQVEGDQEEGCGVYPFFIEETGRECYLNVRMAASIHEEEVTVLPREEYERRMRDLSKWLCAGCIHAEDSPDFKGCIDDMCLDGTCYSKTTEEDMEW